MGEKGGVNEEQGDVRGRCDAGSSGEKEGGDEIKWRSSVRQGGQGWKDEERRNYNMKRNY